MLDRLVDDARRHLADLLLRRITARVRTWWPQAAALRLTADDYRLEVTAVLDTTGTPLPAGSRNPVDEDTPPWSEAAVDVLTKDIGEDLRCYDTVRLDHPADAGVLPLTDRIRR